MQSKPKFILDDNNLWSDDALTDRQTDRQTDSRLWLLSW